MKMLLVLRDEEGGIVSAQELKQMGFHVSEASLPRKTTLNEETVAEQKKPVNVGGHSQNAGMSQEGLSGEH